MIMTLTKFLSQFPNDATSWKNATDEVRDICRICRENIEEFDGIKLTAVDFRSFITPSKWNTKGKKFIANTITKMSPMCKDHTLSILTSHFSITSLK
jgi:hypothetical protein